MKSSGSIWLTIVGLGLLALFVPDLLSSQTQVTGEPTPNKSVDVAQNESSAEEQRQEVCRISQGLDGIVRRVFREFNAGDSVYSDWELIDNAASNLREAIAQRPKLEFVLIDALREQADLSEDVSGHILSVELYDDLDRYLDDFREISLAYVRGERASDFCSY